MTQCLNQLILGVAAVGLASSACAAKIEFPCKADPGFITSWESAQVTQPVTISGVIDVNRIDPSNGVPTANIWLMDARGETAALLRLAVFPRNSRVLTSLIEFTEGRDVVQHKLLKLPLDAQNVTFSLSYRDSDTIEASINGKRASMSGIPLRVAKVGLTCGNGSFTFRNVSTSGN